MAATAEIRITYGASPGTVEEMNAANIPILSADVGADGISPSTYPVRIPTQVGETNYSYERYLQIYVSDIGTSSWLQNIKFYTDTTEIVTGSSLYYQIKDKASYTKPVDTNDAGSTVAEGALVKTSEAEAVTVPIDGDGHLTTGEYSDFVVLQVAMPYGSTNEGKSANIYFVYDEVA